MFPIEINKIIGESKIIEIVDFHRSGDNVYSINDKYILKVSENIERLKNEYIKDKWICKYINSPKPIMFIIDSNKAYYLREYLVGENLCLEKYIKDPELLVDLLVKAINLLHSTKVEDKKYIIDSEYNTLIHGDFCLPNIMVYNNEITGFIDLGDSGIGDPWRDYAWCIWSLEYNLNSKEYTPLLLEKLNISFDEEKYNKYIN